VALHRFSSAGHPSRAPEVLPDWHLGALQNLAGRLDGFMGTAGVPPTALPELTAKDAKYANGKEPKLNRSKQRERRTEMNRMFNHKEHKGRKVGLTAMRLSRFSPVEIGAATGVNRAKPG
jgi:hypothetical protein